MTPSAGSARATGRDMKRTLALVPAYNEAAGIGDVVRRIRAANPGIDIVVVDDGSADATAETARRAGAQVLRLPFNMGYGMALQTGYKYAIRERYDYVVQLDGDGQHEPADAPALLAVVQRGDADLAIGSRFGGDSAYRAPVIRRAGMWLFGGLARLLTGVRFSDVTSGFQALNREIAHFFTAERYPADYPDADVLIMLTRAGFTVKEVPVRMYRNPRGTSMHAGLLRPVWYTFRMLLSIFLTPLRDDRKDPHRHEVEP
jgi:glycosyltransferase involved in cell wall biosynthesis